MRVLGVVVLATVALAACGTAEAATKLTITTRSGGEGPAKTWTLRCGPAGGTLPKAARACSRLAQLKAPFALVSKRVACTEIYGGPQTARVRGVYRGKRVDTVFKRTDGCQIARWNRVSFLFPIFSGTLPPPRD